MSASISGKRQDDNAGFTMVEALVALAIMAFALAAIGSVVSANVRGSVTVERRLSLVETARAILTGLPGRGQLAPGDMTGELGDTRWRLDVMPFDATFVNPARPTPWVPLALVVRVQGPHGEMLRLDTVRLRRAGGQ